MLSLLLYYIWQFLHMLFLCNETHTDPTLEAGCRKEPYVIIRNITILARNRFLYGYRPSPNLIFIGMGGIWGKTTTYINIYIAICIYIYIYMYIYVYIYIYLVLQYYLAARSRDLGKVPGLLSGRVASGAPCAGARRAQRLAKRLL